MSAPRGGGRRDTASIVVTAAPERVYGAFAQAEALMSWLPPGSMSGRALEYDFREGGRYVIELSYDARDGAGRGKTTSKTDVSSGRFLRLEPGQRIVQSVAFRASDPAFAGEMQLSWSFDAVPGGTRVTVTAENVPSGISESDHAAGLRASLENLARYLR